MELRLAPQYAEQQWAKDAQAIVRNCVHCGFCNATCPTYQLFGHESDGPRGRIYLVKQLLEGQSADAATAAHLDRCLTCRACETTCPSGVHYSRLIEYGRDLLEQQRRRHGLDWLQRKAMTWLLPNVALLQAGAKWAAPFQTFMPESMSQMLPVKGKDLSRPDAVHVRKMLLLEGCAQSALTPETNAAAARVLSHCGVMLMPEDDLGCCGAVRLHTGERDKGMADVKARIDSWWPRVQAGIEAIISSASGCGVTVKDYGDMLQHDSDYAEKAAHISAMVLDLSEAVASELSEIDIDWPPLPQPVSSVAFHSPCTLQHGQKINGVIEALLQQRGYTLLPVADGHLCCGSAGTYSVLQPVIAKQLKTNKLEHLQTHSPTVIATANVGCQLHLRSDATVPVVHWIELMDDSGA